MLVVPVQAVPNQTLTIQLANQSVQLNVYQQPYGLFMDVLVNNTLIIGGVLCKNLVRIVRNGYLGFIGDFVWFDTQGMANVPGIDPSYIGAGTRFLLVYLEASDISGDATN